MFAFNSPVWFNIGNPNAKPQSSACFINDVQDTMESIEELIATEMEIFRSGSGAGVNMSNLRSSREKISGGGYSSGVPSFMKITDAGASATKSGGKTRRAAKMVILDADHGDIKRFITQKAEEEKKALMLKEKLLGSDLGALASSNGISIQTANDLSFNNVTLSSVGNEPKVVAAALGLPLNEVSSPIVGENGVFVVKSTFKSEVPPAADLSAYKLRSSSFSSGVQGRLTEALRNAAEIEDNSFDFF